MIYKCPYKGLAPYTEEDARYFFGRDEERTLIADNLRASRLTLLYGESGVGKSSVLSAGVAHQLMNDPDYLLVIFPRAGGNDSWRGDPLQGIGRVIREAVSAKWAPEESADDQLSDLTTVVKEFGSNAKQTLLVILDQFEEYFRYHPKDSGEGTLANEIPRLLYSELVPINILIAIREDELASLDRFKRTIPNMFDNYLRIGYLTESGAHDAIVKPIETQGKEIRRAQELLSAVLGSHGWDLPNKDLTLRTVLAGIDPLKREPEGQALRALLESMGIDQSIPIRDFLRQPIEMPADLVDEVVRQIIDVQEDNKERVQTPYLQLVMTRWWEQEIRAGSQLMRMSTLKDDLGGVRQVVDNYLAATISGLSRHEQEAAAVMFEFMVTSTGRKLALFTSELAEHVKWSGIKRTTVQNVLKKLQQARIVSPVPLRGYPGVGCYEFAHDVVAKAARDWRQRHTLMNSVERAQLEEERAKSEAADAKLEAERAKAQAEQARAETAQAKTETEAVKREADQAKREAETTILRAQQDFEQAKLEMSKAHEAMRLTLGDAGVLREKAIREAEGAKREAEEARLALSTAEAATKAAMSDAENARREALVGKQEADVAIREAAKARKHVKRARLFIASIMLLGASWTVWAVFIARPHLSVDPSSLSFPDTGVGTTASNVGLVTISNTGKVPIYIDGFVITPLGTESGSSREFDFYFGSTTCKLPGNLASSSTCTVQVKFNPSSSGIKSGALRITTNAGEKVVTLSGTAVDRTTK